MRTESVYLAVLIRACAELHMVGIQPEKGATRCLHPCANLTEHSHTNLDVPTKWPDSTVES